MLLKILRAVREALRPQPPDPIENEGFDARLDGRPVEACPFVREEQAARWERGWWLGDAAERAF